MHDQYAQSAASNGPATLLSAECADPLAAFFAGNMNDIGVAHETVSAAMHAASNLMNRLGIDSMYGCAVVGAERPPARGAIEETSRGMSALIESARELRGLCETLAAKL